MFKKILTMIFAIIFINESYSTNISNPKTEIWNSAIGIKRLNTSNYNNDFYQLANFYQAQSNPVFCSSATALAIKNALFYEQIPSQKTAEIIKPSGEVVAYNLYHSQEEFFNDKTDKIKAREIIKFQKPRIIKNPDGTTTEDFDPGLNLQDFAKILKIHKINSKIYYQEQNNDEELANFRDKLKQILSDKKRFIIANFDGRIFGNKTGGHLSPIVAYDDNSDSLLVLDVALHKNQWYWVGIKEMLTAMNSLDGKNYRGYLIVWR